MSSKACPVTCLSCQLCQILKMAGNKSYTIVEYFGGEDGYRCGYCKSQTGNFSRGKLGMKCVYMCVCVEDSRGSLNWLVLMTQLRLLSGIIAGQLFFFALHLSLMSVYLSMLHRLHAHCECKYYLALARHHLDRFKVIDLAQVLAVSFQPSFCFLGNGRRLVE